MSEKRKVVILGGGCGGVAAAWALSNTAERRARYDVCLIQHGHRLGGKGATGRDRQRSQAVLEHGLHLWLGFYRTSFAMIRDLYEHWAGPTTGPQSSLDKAFLPLRDVTLVGGGPNNPELWRMHFPELPGRPWDLGYSEDHGLLHWLGCIKAWARDLPKVFVRQGGEKWALGRVRLLASLSIAMAKGLTAEYRAHGKACWDAMDALDLRAWLQKYGASKAAAEAPPIGALYDLGFAYPDGIAGPDRGAMAAGAGVRALLKLFAAYRGAPFWRMSAGMGDSIFAPAYEVLRERGVRFTFFHRLDALRVNDESIQTIELGVQATPKRAYKPLETLRDIRTWPAEPLYDQLDAWTDGDLEGDCGNALFTKKLERGTDFDEVVLAIPSTSHRHFARELMEAAPSYRRMVEHTTAVPTIAAQWWLAKSHRQLGWRGAPPVVTGLSGLFRTWADMSEVIDSEDWDERPAGLAYFCNVAPPEILKERDRAVAGEFVHAKMSEFAPTLSRSVWPSSGAMGGGFNEGVLHTRHEGESPWELQYARANVRDWERYVLSLPGAMRHRLGPCESGFTNLWLAGDWTRNCINGGSVEGAVSSGMEAAEGLVAKTNSRNA